MTQKYNISGMTCNGCLLKVQKLLEQVNGVNNVNINLEKGVADIEMKIPISNEAFKSALKDYPKYEISKATTGKDVIDHIIVAEQSRGEATETKSWIITYKPILLIFTYIFVISIISAQAAGGFSAMTGMRVFMAGFFLIFSFFKMLDLNGFAESYSMYDIVAKKIKVWGYVYVFIEVLLGICYALDFKPAITNLVTVVVMTISIIGVLKSVLNKRKIRCACLGAVFNLPMSSVTIIEDALMISMSIIMLFLIS